MDRRQPRVELSQVLALAGLLAGASLSLSRLFQDARWALPTWLTIAAALGLAALLRRLGAGPFLALVVLTIGFFVVAGNLLFPDTLAFFVVPTPATLTAMRAATRVALTGMVDQAAPVAVTREFLLVTCAGVWAVTVSAEGLAMRAGQPLLALVPALGLFLFPAMVRASSPGWYTLWFLLGAGALLLHEGRARLATWGQWVAHPRTRPGDGWRLPISQANTTARRLTIGAGVLALAAPWLLPGYGRPPLVDYRSDSGPSATIAINPFVSLRTNLNSRGNVQLFTVDAEHAAYWRLITLDNFDGRTWWPSVSRATARYAPGITAGDLEPGARSERLEQDITVQRLGGTWLPAAQVPVEMTSRRALLANVPSRAVTIQGRWRRGFRYQVVSAAPDPTAELLRVPQDYGNSSLERYLALPQVDPVVAALARQHAGGAATPYDQALALQDWLRDPDEFSYDLDVPELAQGGDQLVEFLTRVRRGYCEQFAAAMAVLARTLGIPSRVAVGFTAGTLGPDGFQVTARDAHAWPELFFSGVGWVRFEPTPRPDQISEPTWTTPTGRLTTPTTTIAPGATSTPTPGPSLPGSRLPEEQQGPTGGAGGGGPGLLASPFVRALLAVVALVALVPAVKATRRRLGTRAAREPRAAVRDAWTSLGRWALDAGLGRAPAETPARWARRLGAAVPAAAAPLTKLTRSYMAAEFASAAPSTEQAAEARALAGTARSELAEGVGRRRRIAAAFSLRSLLAREPSRRRARRAQAAGG